ncbi:hypothetical protein SAMN05421874_103248 [Nonomuraea maritima]|jgi:hypothetical protein|uniref:Uncharacterized protein n=1 Tax=Nonomuraea maritima TaxID=683260 RepID=A0A1G8WPH3_9ACTN|nr:hypothetical protein [Nonomuraea maritima]SDJ79996.1 hypothetical protein SAMN05421874_103248 [Nonomuraea maritima]
MFRHTLASGLVLAATSLVMAGAPAVADVYAPYARAGAIIDADGTLNNAKNITSARRVAVGSYCVEVAETVNAANAIIQLTPRHARRLPHIAYRNPSALCGQTNNTVAVQVYSTVTNQLADSGFDLAIL